MNSYLQGVPKLLVLCALLLGDQQISCDEEYPFVVAAYFPEYRSYVNVNKTSPYLTDLILFSLAPDAQGNLGPCCLEPHHYTQGREARAYKKQEFPDEQPLKLWLSIGGAGRSNAFARVASDSTLRKKFILNLRNLVEQEQLDGIDFDWEAPQTQEQYQSYMQLVYETYQELHQKAGILISVALHPRQVFPSDFYNFVSRINLMTYDMIDGKGGSHASKEQMKAAIKLLSDAKCPTSKIMIGIPAYARHGRKPGDVKTYSEVIDMLENADPKLDLKGVSQKSSYQGFAFDSPNDVREKVGFAVKEGHAGVFFWELGQDKQHDDWAPGGMLLEAAANQARSSRKTKSPTTADEL